MPFGELSCAVQFFLDPRRVSCEFEPEIRNIITPNRPPLLSKPIHDDAFETKKDIRAVIQKRVLCPRADQEDHVILTKGARVRIVCTLSEVPSPCLVCTGCGRCDLSEEVSDRLVPGFNPRHRAKSSHESMQSSANGM